MDWGRREADNRILQINWRIWEQVVSAQFPAWNPKRNIFDECSMPTHVWSGSMEMVPREVYTERALLPP